MNSFVNSGMRNSEIDRAAFRWRRIVRGSVLVLLLAAHRGYPETTEVAGAPDVHLPSADEFLLDVPDSPRPATPAAGAPDRQFRSLLREGTLEVQAGNHEAAVRLFRQAVMVSPRDKTARFSLGTSLLATRQYDQAERMLQTLQQEYTDDHYILNNLAWLYATSSDIRFRNGEHALRYARKALLLAPSAHYVWSTLAEAYYVSGQYASAVRAAEQAVQLARERGADESKLRDYQHLLSKCRQAARAFDILD